MKRIDETDVRKAGLVPCGSHWGYKGAKQLFERLQQNYKTIHVAYEHCINCHKRQWEWKYYIFVGVEGNNVLLRELTEKPISEEEKAFIMEEAKKGNYEPFNSLFGRERVISEEITKLDIVDVLKHHDAYQARVEVE